MSYQVASVLTWLQVMTIPMNLKHPSLLIKLPFEETDCAPRGLGAGGEHALPLQLGVTLQTQVGDRKSAESTVKSGWLCPSVRCLSHGNLTVATGERALQSLRVNASAPLRKRIYTIF